MELETAVILPQLCWAAIGCAAPLLGIIVVKCMFCGGFLGVKRAKGAGGGISHGLGQECMGRFKK